MVLVTLSSKNFGRWRSSPRLFIFRVNFCGTSSAQKGCISCQRVDQRVIYRFKLLDIHPLPTQFIWYSGRRPRSRPRHQLYIKSVPHTIMVHDGLLRRVSCALVSPSPTLSGALLVWTCASSCNKPKLTARVVRLALLIDDGPSSEVGYLRKHFILALLKLPYPLFKRIRRKNT